jgi:DNA-binding MarR family transcriptional regulator
VNHALGGERQVDVETRASDDHHQALRLWLRLLACTGLIETEIRSRLRSGFGTTLPRFDLMAQLERHPAGLRMTELSRRMMVTSGNITGITDQLVVEGLVKREPDPRDRRAFVVKLTPAGRRLFDRMAAEHEGWIAELFAGLAPGDIQRLYTLLAKLKGHVAALHAAES